MKEAIEKLMGYDVYLADSSLLTPLEAEKKPKIVIMCPNQQAMKDIEKALQALAHLRSQPSAGEFMNGQHARGYRDCAAEMLPKIEKLEAELKDKEAINKRMLDCLLTFACGGRLSLMAFAKITGLSYKECDKLIHGGGEEAEDKSIAELEKLKE